MEKTPTYTVCTRCFTYNQAKYITDAMKGFVMQETSFPFVCTIVDDASTDGEQEVIRNYVQENFNLNDTSVAYEKEEEYGHVIFARHKTNENCYFAVIFLNENHYSQKKSKLPYLREWLDHAKYIALCEGDDYWTDSMKLQKQVEYMEEHPDCTMCAHSVDWDINGELERRGCQYQKSCKLTTNEVIENGGLYLATCSLLYRTEISLDRAEWRKKADVGDYPLQILGALKGYVYFISDTMGVYRFLHEGSWSSAKINNSRHLKNEISWMKILDNETNGIYTSPIYNHLLPFYRELFLSKEISLADYSKATFCSSTKPYMRLIKDCIKSILSTSKHNKD